MKICDFDCYAIGVPIWRLRRATFPEFSSSWGLQSWAWRFWLGLPVAGAFPPFLYIFWQGSLSAMVGFGPSGLPRILSILEQRSVFSYSCSCWGWSTAVKT